MVTLCAACGTSYDPPESACKICQDARQFIPPTGQAWISLSELTATHTNKWHQHEPGLLSIETVPKFAIGQRAFLLKTPEGNILWDCIANLDDATQTLVEALGGIHAIAVSHPHYYTTMQDWADRFRAPIYLHSLDREWVVRPTPALNFWTGDTLPLTANTKLVRLGGHFAGGTVLHSTEGTGLVLAGDIIAINPGRDRVSFLWSYPNLLPLSAPTIRNIAARVNTLQFDRMYGAFGGQDITSNARQIVLASSRQYLDCLASY